MSSPSGGGGNTTTTQQQSGPPPQVLQNYQNLTNAASTLAGQNPLSLYSSPMVAGFTPAQQAGFSEVANSQGIGVPYLNAAAQEFGQATAPLYDTVQNYESPYTRDVTNSLTNLFDQQNAQQQAQIQGNATSRGAYGGDREAVAQALAAQQENLSQAPTLAQTLQQGYSTGLSADEAQSWLASQAGFGIGALGPQAQSEALTGANALMGIGGMQQQLAQNQMNIPYQQFTATQAYPYQNIGFLAPIVEGTGSLSGGTGTGSTTTPGPTALSQVAGLGELGLGLAGGAQNIFGSNTGQGATSFGQGGFSGVVNPTGVSTGGRIGRAEGGGIGGETMPGAMKIPTGIPTIDLSYIPQGVPSANADKSMLSPMQPNVTTTTTGAGATGSGLDAGSLLSAGKSAAGLFGNAAGDAAAAGGAAALAGGAAGAGDVAGALSALFLLKQGGRIGYDDGGTVLSDPTHRGGIGLPAVPQISIDQIIKPGPEVKGAGMGAGPPKVSAPPAAPPAPSPLGDLSGLAKSAKSLFGNNTASTSAADTPGGSSRGGGIGHYDAGGSTVPVQVAAQFGGASPASQNQLSALQGLPIEKLQEMAVQYPPNTPQGQLVAMALRQKQANPGAQQPQQQQQQQPGGIGAQPSAAGTSMQQADTGSYGGTAHAAGGSVGDGLGYVTEDELDPHPIVDHSGDTVKIRYPSEGKVLDLGLPSIGGRRSLAVGGASGGPSASSQFVDDVTSGGNATGGQTVQFSDGSTWAVPQGWTFRNDVAYDQYGQFDPYRLQLPAPAAYQQPAAAAPPPSPPPPPPPPPPVSLPPTPQVSNFSAPTKAANGVNIPQLNADAFSIQNLMNDPFTGQPYTSGGGNGGWFAPLQQYQPPGTNLPQGNSNGFPAYQPNVAGMGLISGPLSQIGTTPSGSTAGIGGGKRGGNVQHFDDGGDVYGDPSIPAMPASTTDTMATATAPSAGDQPIAPIERQVSDEPTLERGPKRKGETATPPARAVSFGTGLGRPTAPESDLGLSPDFITPQNYKPVADSVDSLGLSTAKYAADTAPPEAPKGGIGVAAPVAAGIGAQAMMPDDSDTYQPPGAPVPRGTEPPAAAAPAGGITKVGWKPDEVLGSFTGANFSGKPVYISSGTSNDPSKIDLTASQIKAAQSAGASQVYLYGVGSGVPNYRNLNERLSQIAAANGAQFVPLSGTEGGRVHPTGEGYTSLASGLAPNAVVMGDSIGEGIRQAAGQRQPGPASAQQQAPAWDDKSQWASPGQPTAGDPRGMVPVIRAAAARFGVDPDMAVRVAQTEGLAGFRSNISGERSYSAFQLNMEPGSLGDRFQKATGLDPADPKNEVAAINWTMAQVPHTGWQPFHGAANTGIGNWAGISNPSPGAGADVALAKGTGVIGHQPGDVISDAPGQNAPTGIGTDVASRTGIGQVQQAIQQRSDDLRQHHGFNLSDYSLPLLIAGLTTLASRSPNAVAEGFKAAAPFFTAQEKQEAAQYVAEARQATNATTNQYKMDALSQKALADKQRADDAAARLKETGQHHADTLALQQSAADALSKYRQTQLELAAARVETGLYAPPTYGEGDDPDHPGQKAHGTWYLPKNPNSGVQPMFVPGVGTAKAPTGEAAIYDNLIKAGAAKDIPDAARIIAEAKRDPKTFEHSDAVAKLVQAEIGSLRNVPDNMGKPQATLEALARKNVLSRLGIAGSTPAPAPAPAAPAQQAPAAAPAQPAPKPAEAAPPQQPAPAADHPPVVQNGWKYEWNNGQYQAVSPVQ